MSYDDASGHPSMFVQSIGASFVKAGVPIGPIGRFVRDNVSHVYFQTFYLSETNRVYFTSGSINMDELRNVIVVTQGYVVDVCRKSIDRYTTCHWSIDSHPDIVSTIQSILTH